MSLVESLRPLFILGVEIVNLQMKKELETTAKPVYEKMWARTKRYAQFASGSPSAEVLQQEQLDVVAEADLTLRALADVLAALYPNALVYDPRPNTEMKKQLHFSTDMNDQPAGCLLAREELPAGTTLLTETPLFTFALPKGTLSAFSYNVVWAEVIASIVQLRNITFPPDCFVHKLAPREEDANTWNGLKNKMRTNSFSGGELRHLIFPVASMINHTCTPNSETKLDDSKSVISVTTLRRVPKNHEITIAYNSFVGDCIEARRSMIAMRYGFICMCEYCSGRTVARLPSDTLVELQPLCYWCGSDSKGAAKKCSGCGNACYCDANCQRKHWALHKSRCKKSAKTA
jgi:hypothetical protein